RINCLGCNFILSRLGLICYVGACPPRILQPVTRFVALFLCALLPFAAGAAEKHKAHLSKTAAVADVARDGTPNLMSTGVLVLDPATGQTLFSKNADQAAPIASITKLMTAMIVLDAKLAMDEAIEISSEDIDTIKNTRSRLPIGTHFRRDDLLRLALMASDNRAAAALGRTYPGGTHAAVAAMN